MKIAAIVQARMSSTRLPGKVLLSLGKRTVIDQVFHQLSFSSTIGTTVLATTSDTSDDILAEWGANHQKNVFRGNLDDVLKRYYDAARQFNADVVVRVTGDCPLIDPDVTDLVVERFLKGDLDYASNVQPPTFPDGLDTEVFSIAALELANREATLHSEREHVTPFIKKNARRFRIGNVKSAEDYSRYRWTIDTKEDLDFVRQVLARLQPPLGYVRMHDVIDLLSANPTLARINAHIRRDEGYAISLKHDKENT